MFFSIFYTGLVSLIIILLAHSLWNYLRDTFTEKKTKDLVGSHIQKYKTIIEELQKKTAQSEITEEDKEVLDDDLDKYILTLDSSSTTRIDL
jgi:flagellar biosynthesis component FlhA